MEEGMKYLFSFVFLVLLALQTHAAETENLVPDGEFKQATDDSSLFKGWYNKWGKWSLVKEGGKKWAKLEGKGGVDYEVRIKPDWRTIKVTCRMKTTGAIQGKENWQTPRIAMQFTDEKRKHVGNWPKVPYAVGDKDWFDFSEEYVIPDGATRFRVTPSNMGEGGIVEFADVRVMLGKIKEPVKDLEAPTGFSPDPEMKSAWKVLTPNKGKICLNSLWQFIPVTSREAPLPAPGSGWGWFKVPGVWPTKESYGKPPAEQKILLCGAMDDQFNLFELQYAWYKRDIVVPADWAGRKIEIDFTMLQSYAKVLIDGNVVGELIFPGGRMDLTRFIKPGTKQQIAILVGGIPLSKEQIIFMAAGRTFAVKGGLTLKGITSDLYLQSSPATVDITDLRARPSFRQKSLTIDLSVRGLGKEGATLELVASLGNDRKVFTPIKVLPEDIKNGRVQKTFEWTNPQLWDTDTPQNLYHATAVLKDNAGNVIAETTPIRFGFREFWIDGRDFYLNGKRIHLRALVLDNMNMAAGQANKAACTESIKRLKAYGFNFFITHNYAFGPGSVSYMNGMLEAADEQGVLCAFSMPHAKDFSWNLDDEKTRLSYQSLVNRLVSLVGNHPSIAAYTMNHNSCGYKGDQNPLYLHGKFDPSDPASGGAPSNVREQALKAAQLCKEIDPSRPVYHHSSGNLGDMYTLNIYLDWAPRQERSDWLENWEKEGTKPLFFVEWGLPHNASWSSYRGPHFIWRTPAYQHCWTSEFAVVDMGTDAYNMTDKNLRAQQNEVNLFSTGKVFSWSALSYFLRQSTHNYLDVQAWYANDNWRSHRARGLSAGLPWDQEGLWRRNGNISKKENENPKPYSGIDQPGIIADMTVTRDNYLYAPIGVSYTPTVLGNSFLRWNMPLCAFIAGEQHDFSEKRHIYRLGDSIQKSFILLNDKRNEIDCTVKYNLAGTDMQGSFTAKIAPGGRKDIPFTITLPTNMNAVDTTLNAEFAFSDGTKQSDQFTIHVINALVKPAFTHRVLVYDPSGDTTKELDKKGIKYTKINNLNTVDDKSIVILGRKSIKLDDQLESLIPAIRNGARLVIFEQSSEILRDRLGLRDNIHGMRSVYKASDNAPITGKLHPSVLQDWGGSATSTPPFLSGANRSDPQWNWMGFDNTRVWRCGNRGNVASILPEKPVLGNFTPLALCGFDLQYCPLLQFTEGKGLVILCQMDVTARTQNCPGADSVLTETIKYADSFTPSSYRTTVFSGDEKSEQILQKLGVTYIKYNGNIATPAKTLLILGNGFDNEINASTLAANGVQILCLGLNDKQAERVGVNALQFKTETTLAQYTDQWQAPEFLAIGNQDLFWRGEIEFASIQGDAGIGNNALRAIKTGLGNIVFCQAAPWMFEEKQDTIFRKSLRRNYWLVSQLLRNLGADMASSFLENLATKSCPSSIELPASWVGLVDKNNIGQTGNWFKPEHDIKEWKPIKVPGMFDEQIADLADYDGLFWYRLDFDVPEGTDGEGLNLFLGAVDDESWVWLNGEFLGEVSKKTHPKDYYRVPREYILKTGSLKSGQKNTLVVLVNDTYLKGGMRSKPALRSEGKWLKSYYIQKPKADDDPYRYYRW